MNDQSYSQTNFDVIIVGAGAAGCVLAGRLSEIPDKRVLLIEAGPDAQPGHEHRHILDPFPASSGNMRFFWPGLSAESGAAPGDGNARASSPFCQGFGVGGGSNVNGMAADRGQSSDYDEWCDLGARGWAWRDVLPYFNKLERDLDFAGPLHGEDGPMPVRRVRPEQWAPFAKALANVFRSRGAALIDDSNADFRDGVSSVSMSCLADRRVSASMAYLTDQVRRRPNLAILPNTMAERLDICDGRLRGVHVCTPRGPRAFAAPEVIIACGAVYSPTLLLRSGVGPAGHLRSMGIDVVRDLRGVGQSLQNHPWVPLATYLKAAGMQPPEQRAWQQNQLRYSSGVAGCSERDMLFLIFNKTAWHALGRRVGVVGVFVLKPYSRGYVELVSANPTAAPHVSFNLLEDDRDFKRMVDGVRIALDVLGDGSVLKTHHEVFVANAAVEAHLATPTSLHRLEAWLISAGLKIAPLRRAVLRSRSLDSSSMVNDEPAIRDYVRLSAQAVYHVSGTCRMGAPDDPLAVVDPNGVVFGIGGLRVVDASIFPTIPSGQTHFPVLMAAEKIADGVKEAWHDPLSARQA